MRRFHLLTEDLDDYLRDESRLTGFCEGVFLPANEAELGSFLRACHEAGARVTVSGARTGIAGGAVPAGGFVLCTGRLAGIREVRRDEAADEWLVRLAPGTTLAALQGFAAGEEAPEGGIPAGLAEFRRERRRFFFPVDATETSASVGGLAATNASGARSLGYGAARRYVRSLRVFLADGDALSLRRGEAVAPAGGTLRLTAESGRELAVPAPAYRTPPVKHTAGYFAAPVLDAVDLFIGAEGTLGAIGEVELALVPAPAAWFGGLAFFPAEESALDFVRLVRDERPADAAACRPAVLEYFDRAALDLADRSGRRREIGLPAMPHDAGAAVYFEQGCGVDELETLFAAYDRVMARCGSSADAVWSALEEREQAKLKSLRHLVPEEVNRLVAENRRHCPAIHKVGTDLSVPNAALEALVRAYRTRLAEEGIPAVVFGHLGENNLHVNMLPRDEEELGRAKALHREWASLAVSLGGTVAAEHGIGRLKGELLHLLYGPGELAQMAAVKRALDPGGILNPGHVLSNP